MAEFHYFVGLDLGQAQDYTAMAVVEREGESRPSSVRLQDWRPAPPRYDVRHLQRFPLSTPYPDIVLAVGRMLQDAKRTGASVTLVVDETGVGRPVLDLLHRANLPARLVGITITGGDTVNREPGGRNYRVPKRDLISATKVLLQADRLKFVPGLPEERVVRAELDNFQVRIDPRTAHDSYAVWREGVHDDLVLALTLAVWFAEYIGRGVFVG